jgi:hypothetical protein
MRRKLRLMPSARAPAVDSTYEHMFMFLYVGRVVWLRRAALVLALALALMPATAQASPGAAWLRERINLEWVAGSGGWRSSLGPDVRAPGFDAFAGGGEVLVGLDIGLGLGIVFSGRVLAGAVSGVTTYVEGLGSAGVQLRVGNRVRVRAGAAAGQARFRGDMATMVGGFLAGSIDLFPLGGGRLSTTLTLRLDLDGDVGAQTYLPDQSLALALGLGFRY